jgi:NHL repeat
MPALARTLVALGLCQMSGAQIITTVAGTNWFFPNPPIRAVNAPLGSVTAAAVDANGNLYVADSGNDVVMRIAVDGTLTVVAGNGIRGFSGDGGVATDASLSLEFSACVAVDAAGSLYVADGYRVRKVSGGIITTVAGDGSTTSSGDGGLATSAGISVPRGVAVDFAGNLYIAEFDGSRIRRVSGGIITTFAGNGIKGFSGDGGPATKAELCQPSGLAIDAAGHLFVADRCNFRVREISGGIITTVAGDGTLGFSGDGGPSNGRADVPAELCGRGFSRQPFHCR